MATTWLYRYSDSKPAAWTPDEVHYYAAGGGSYLAWRSDNWLYQVNGGSALGWFDGDTVYDPGGKPLYFAR